MTREKYIWREKITATLPKEAFKEGIGIVFQELSLVPSLSVADNLFLEVPVENKLSVQRHKIIRNKTKEILKKYDVEEIDPDTLVEELTLSEKQIIEIVKVVSRETKVVVFDEATSALTDNRVKWLYKLVKKLKEEQRIVVFISHRMGEIREFCDVVTVFRNGKDVGRFDLSEIDNSKLVDLMLGRKVNGYYPDKKNAVMDKVALEAKNLSFENFLRDVSFTLNYGEVVGLGGLAGQGQNSLMMMLAGCVKPQKGQLILDGREVTFSNPGAAMKQGVVLLPEERATEGLVLEMSMENA